jgi:hypothetical protein
MKIERSAKVLQKSQDRGQADMKKFMLPISRWEMKLQAKYAHKALTSAHPFLRTLSPDDQ